MSKMLQVLAALMLLSNVRSLAWGQVLPPLQPATQPATISGDDQTRRIVQKMIEAFCGSERLKAVKATRSVARGSLLVAGTSQELRIMTIIVFPDHMYTEQERTSPEGNKSMSRLALSPKEGWTQEGSRPASDLSDAVRARGLGRLYASTLSVLTCASDPRYSFATLGSKRVGDVEATVLQITGPTKQTSRWLIDPNTGRPLQAIDPMPTPGDEAITDYLEWTTVDGVLNARRIRTRFPDGSQSELEWDQEINPKVEMTVFQKPAGSTRPAIDAVVP